MPVTTQRSVETNAVPPSSILGRHLTPEEITVVMPPQEGRLSHGNHTVRLYGVMLSREVVRTEQNVAVERTLYLDQTEHPSALVLVERRHRRGIMSATLRRYALDMVAAVYAGVDALPVGLRDALTAARQPTAGSTANFVSDMVVSGATDAIVRDELTTVSNPDRRAPVSNAHDYTMPTTEMIAASAADAAPLWISEEAAPVRLSSMHVHLEDDDDSDAHYDDEDDEEEAEPEEEEEEEVSF